MCHIDYQSLNVSALSRVNLTALTLKVTLSKDQLIYCYILPNNGLFFPVQRPKSPIVEVTLMLDIQYIALIHLRAIKEILGNGQCEGVLLSQFEQFTEAMTFPLWRIKAAVTSYFDNLWVLMNTEPKG